MNLFKTSGLALTVLLSAANCFAFGSGAPAPLPTNAPESLAGRLCDAIAKNDLAAAQTVVTAGVTLASVECLVGDPDSQQNASPLWTALMDYRANNCPTMDMINLMIKSGANVNEVYNDDNRYTPLDYAVVSFDTPALALDLLGQGALVVATVCNSGCQNNLVPTDVSGLILSRLNSVDWLGLMSKLLDGGMQVNNLAIDSLQVANPDLWVAAANMLLAKFPNQTLFDGNLTYTLAGNGVSFEQINWGLGHGLSFDTVFGNQTATPFQTALQNDQLATVQEIMRLANRAIQPMDAFYAISNANDATVFPFVVQNAPNLSAQLSDGSTLLMSVLNSNSNATVVQEVLAKTQNLGLERNTDPSFALAIAASSSTPDVVKALITAGADVNQISSVNQKTALQEAIKHGQTPNALELLQVAQKSINNVDKDGFTALTSAASLGNADMITALVATSGVNVNAQDRNGETPLMYAVQANNVPSVVELLTHGACIKTIDNTGHTALEEAYDHNYTDVTSVLNIYMAQPNHC
jgi:ankyrin repeat protein